MRAWLTAFLVTAAAIAAFAAPARAGSTGNVVVQWYTSAIVQMTLTPNYNAGYGPVKAVFGTQPTPVPQSGTSTGSGPVNFGTVEAGFQYLYKYAAHVNVASNDTAGFNLYAEGTADFTDGAGSTMMLGQTLYYVPSSASGDTNSGFSAGYPFSVTSGSVSATTPPSISYIAYPSPVYSSMSENGDVYQDYEMKVPATANASNYYVWIVYTVVAK